MRNLIIVIFTFAVLLKCNSVAPVSNELKKEDLLGSWVCYKWLNIERYEFPDTSYEVSDIILFSDTVLLMTFEKEMYFSYNKNETCYAYYYSEYSLADNTVNNYKTFDHYNDTLFEKRIDTVQYGDGILINKLLMYHKRYDGPLLPESWPSTKCD